MGGMVPWSEHSGEIIERVIATFICLENPDSVHVRSSNGDGGMDVIRNLESGGIAVYQVKKFASSLNFSQKQQIINSWTRLNEYVSAEGIALAKWYLVMPLNPTKEDLKWLENVTANTDTMIQWVGKTHIDGWAAKRPFVPDYYFNGNSKATLSIAKEFLEAARLPDITDREGFKSQLMAIQELLSKIDPNYSYDLQLMSSFDFDAPMKIESRAGLVMTTIEGMRQGGAVRIDVFMKHSAAADLAPLSGRIALFADDPEHKQELQNYLDFGIPLKSFPASISAKGQTLLSEPEDARRGKITMFEYEPSKFFQASVRNCSGDTVDLIQTSFHRGCKGFVWEGAATDGMLSIRIKGELNGGKTGIEVFGSLDFLKGCSPSNANRKLRFLLSGFEKPLTLYFGEAALVDFSLSEIGMKKERLQTLHRVAECLITIDTVSPREVAFPEKITGNEFQRLKQVANIIAKRNGLGSWAAIKLDSSSDTTDKDPLLLQYTESLTLVIGDEVFECGFVIYNAIGLWDDNAKAFFPTEKYGNNLIYDYLGSDLDIAKTEAVLTGSSAPGISEWQTRIRELGGDPA